MLSPFFVPFEFIFFYKKKEKEKIIITTARDIIIKHALYN